MKKYNLEPIEKASDLLRGCHYFIPSIPRIEPIQPDKRHHFIGNMATLSSTESPPDFLFPNPENPLIYFTIGGGALRQHAGRFFSIVIEAFAGKPLNILIATGGLTFKHHAMKNIIFRTWVPGYATIKKARMVVHHGGYNTTMEVLTAGKPSLIIPFHSEQEGNARRVALLKCGRFLLPSTAPQHPVSSRWEYGIYTYLVRHGFTLTADELNTAVMEVLENKSYRENAENISIEISRFGGPEQAVNLLYTD